jgi:hypothetical protein
MGTGRMQAFEDRAAILVAIDHYFFCMDRRRFDDLVFTFWPEARVSYDEGRDGTFENLDDLIAHFGRRRTRRAHYSHMRASFSVALRGNEAEADTFGTIFLVDGTDRPTTTVSVRGVQYRDRLERRNGEWRISMRVHRPLWQFETAAKILAAGHSGRVGLQDGRPEPS